MFSFKTFYRLCIAVVLIAAASACSDDDKKKSFVPQSKPGVCPMENLSLTICDSAGGPFATISTNRYFPFAVGNKWVLEGDEDDESVVVEIEVLDETEEVAGVTTRVIKATEYVDGELIEIALDFFAMAPDGTVCYFGEDVDNYEEGELANHDGTWRAGEDSNLPGIQMPGDPKVGQAYFQELAPGTAEDMGEIVAKGEKFDTPFGSFKKTVTVLDTNPLDDCEEVETKGYAQDVGLVFDDGKLLTSFE